VARVPPLRFAGIGYRRWSHQRLEYHGDKLYLCEPCDSLILGYLTQYAILPMRVVSASLAAVPRSLEEAAWLSGAGWLTTLRRIVTPLAGRGLFVAWLISYVFSLRDVAMSIVVYPPGYDTLPVRILTLMANGAPSLIAALCIILITITIVPLGAAGLWLKLGTNRQ